jgi:diguanylate cyclase (GGDEF)-like protein/PAS domain S-box-containing protein
VLLLAAAERGIALEPGKRIEQYVRTIWTVDSGLPQSSVLGISQTPDGYVWAATQEGFVRFDGAEFVTYDKKTYPQFRSQLSTAIRGTRDGSLYVGTMDGGLIRVRGDVIDLLTEDHGLPSDSINTLLETADGSLWIGTSAGLAQLSRGRIRRFPANELPHVDVNALAEDATGRLWIATDGGLISTRNGRVSRHAPEGGFGVAVVSLAVGRDGSLWIGTDGNGLFRHRDGVITRVGGPALARARVTAVLEDRQATLWIGTQGLGFWRLRGESPELDSANREPVAALAEDREGNIWVGRGGGLERLADGVIVTFSKSEGLADDDAKSVTADLAGSIWVGTRQGVDNLSGAQRLSKRTGLSSSYVLSTWMARDGSLWIGTADAGLNRVKNDKITTYDLDDGLPSDGVLALYEDRRGAMWVGTTTGVTRIVDGRVSPEPVLASLLSDEPISSIAEGSNGAIWIGTHEQGVVRYVDGQATAFSKRNGLSNNFVVSIYEDADGAVWIGTAGGGLNRFLDGKISSITSGQGLQDDSVFAILEDRRGNFWMSSNKGIFRARLDDLNAVADGRRPTLRSVIYGRTDGMKSRECNGGTQPVAWKAPDGVLWFATTGGAVKIDPEKALQPGPTPPILMERIYVDNAMLARGAAVPAGHRSLDFHYTSPTYKTPDKLRFEYRLDDFDPHWVDAGARRVAYYTNVPPGSYTFRVRAVNSEGAASEAATATVTIEPFFYQTFLFWGLVAVALLTAALTAHQWRIRLIRANAERFKLLFDRNLAGVYRARIDGRLLDCNLACMRILGLPSTDAAVSHVIFDSYADPAAAESLMQRLREDGAVSGVETALKRPDGTPIWALQNVSLAQGAGGQEILEATLIDITDRKRAEEQIRYQAYHDALTDLPNRSLFKDRLSQAVAHAERRSRQVAVLFLDLDRFKLINDTLGHTIGDHLLQGMADRLQSCVREEDSVARVGGDEFTILLMDLRRPADAMVVARKILDVVARPITVDGHELYVTCSIGISMSPTDGTDAETLLKNADNALYRAKESGKNNYQLCTPSMTQLAAERLALENALRQALDRNEFLVLYQPQYDLRTRRIIAVEALLRWNRPGFGMVGPSAFIAAAEESRLIVPIGEFVLETAAEQARHWTGDVPLRIAVNVSPAQFRQRHLVRSIRTALEEHSLEPTRLEVEITESTAMENPAVTADILQELKELGVSIAIDDFGIGHSSLNYLKRFPIDGLKIDRTFVEDMTTDASDAGIVAAIIAMAHALNLRVTAEGVETEEQLRLLESHGCSSIQGYLVGRPVTAEEMTATLRSGVRLSPTKLVQSAS